MYIIIFNFLFFVFSFSTQPYRSVTVTSSLTYRCESDVKAKFYRRQSEVLSKTKRRSIENKAKFYRRPIEVLSNDFCFQLTYPRRFIALQNALTKSNTGISFLNFVIIACFFALLNKTKEGKVLHFLKSASNLNGNLNCSKELEHYAS